MKRLIVWILLLPLVAVWGQSPDPELAECRAALARACESGHRDSLSAACCHLSEYYAYRDVDSTSLEPGECTLFSVFFGLGYVFCKPLIIRWTFLSNHEYTTDVA